MNFFEQRVSKIKKHLNEIDYLFDLGPARQNTEAWMFLKYYPKIKIIGFEPSKIRYNSIKNVYPGELYNKAISETSGVTNGYSTSCPNPKDRTFNFVLDPKNENVSVQIESCMLDSFYDKVKNFNKIFIWADVDGYECSILKSATKLFLKKKIARVSLELNNYPWIQNYMDSINFLEKHNFCSIEPENLHVPKNSHKDCIFVRKK
jgi:FkbM family methyltransferase